MAQKMCLCECQTCTLVLSRETQRVVVRPSSRHSVLMDCYHDTVFHVNAEISVFFLRPGQMCILSQDP